MWSIYIFTQPFIHTILLHFKALVLLSFVHCVALWLLAAGHFHVFSLFDALLLFLWVLLALWSSRFGRETSYIPLLWFVASVLYYLSC